MSVESYFARAWEIARAELRAGKAVALQSVLDRAMWDHLDHITLAAGEGAEARRLLEMVAWDRIPQARWPEVFDALRMAAAAKALGYESWEATTRTLLAEDGWLAGEAERTAA